MALKRISSSEDYKSSFSKFKTELAKVEDESLKSSLMALHKKLEKSVDKIKFITDRAVKDKARLSSLLKKTTEDLQSSLAAEKRFLASMSHEIRTPLNSIVGFTDLLAKTSLNANQREFVNNINMSSEHLLSLINNVLDISKIEAGQMELSESEVDLELVLMDVAMLISSRVNPSVDLQVNIPELDYLVKIDVLRVKQIFINLLANASKFTSEGFISLSLLEIAPRSEGKVWIKFCVADSGIGISKDKIDNLFQAFTQAHSSKHGGTGLGLYLSKSITSVMGGNLYVKSEQGKGSEFFIELLINTGKKRSEQYDFKKRKILLIEADEHFSEQLELKLMHANCQLKCLNKNTSLHQILMEILSNHYDILILDIDSMGSKSALPLLEICTETYPKMLQIATLQHDQLLDHSEHLITLQKPFPFHLLAKLIQEHELNKNIGSCMDYSDLKVLLVEDVKMNVLLARAMFKKYFNLNFEHAENGQVAVDKVHNGNYDIIFMDIQMPIMDGISATKAIREFDQHTAIYAMTANALAEDSEQSIQAGMNGFITKPVKKQNIENALKEVVIKLDKR